MRIGQLTKWFSLFKGRQVHSVRGVNLWCDLKRWLPTMKIRNAFDVGANLGQSAIDICEHHPECVIWCFEPIPATYQLLENQLRQYSNCKLFPIALGAKVSHGIMEVNLAASDTNRIISTAEDRLETGDSSRLTVPIETLDHFVSKHAVGNIDFLKIDTEGHDLDVLQGAVATLKARKTGILQVEAGMNPENRLHVPLQRFIDFLYPLDYLLFGLYEQMHEWPTGEPHLRRCNAVFISRELVASHRV